MRDNRVPAARGLHLAAASRQHLRSALAAAVAKFQKSRGLKDDGALAPATVNALNGPSHEQRLGAILVTLERWRWMPRDLAAPT